eukprot:gnl/MRDRNA2_/MRDRNA2_63874_c0_seq1.p1 gnl/MRDRNA2_/MRDRNA2_63874_c0~~gnl/MRDRNA2_/MRDRNA2_63874_c0_seq1.p1  ORF type:complete len:638 (-),score=89.37 gnl/MRDRNA2_/MRDRNA2_63874_c0_seq1:400-2313(-)
MAWCNATYGALHKSYKTCQLGFTSAVEEDAFVKSRAQLLLRNSRIGLGITFVLMILVVLMNPHHCMPNHHSLPEANLAPRVLCYGAFWFGMSVVVVIFILAPRLWSSRRGEKIGEIVITCCVVLGITLVALWNNYYAAKLFGLDVEDVWGTFPYADAGKTHLLLEMVAFISVSNVLLPIRVSILWVEVPISLSIVAILSFVVDSPTGMMISTMHFSLVAVICFAMYAGRWDLERHERQHYVSLLQEKRRRFAAEHAADLPPECLHCIPQPDQLSKTTDKSSTFTGKVFNALTQKTNDHDSDADPWREVKELGRREHWMLESDDFDLEAEDLYSRDSQNYLGEGRSARVLKSCLHGTPVAIKITKDALSINNSSSKDHQQRAYIVTEIRILRRLRHPNIVLLHGVAALPNTLGIIMEFVPGPNLKEFICSSNEAEKIILGGHRRQLLIGLVRALRYLHSQQPIVVHGDLKPENVLVEPHSGRDGFPRSKLADFGMSRLLARSSKAQKDRVGGTIRWAAPEVVITLLGEECFEHLARLPSVDTYAFATITYFTASNKLPMAGMTGHDIVRHLVTTSFLPPLNWPDHLHALRAVLQDCMVTPPEKRSCLALVQFAIERLADEDFEPTDSRKSQCNQSLSL